MDRYEELLEDGRLFLANGNYGKASDIFDEMIEKYPDEVKGYEGAIRAYSFDFREENRETFDKLSELLDQMSELVEQQNLYEYSEFIQKVSIYLAGQFDFNKVEDLKNEMKICEDRIDKLKKVFLGCIVVGIFIQICKMRYVFTGGTSEILLVGCLVGTLLVALNLLMQQLKKNTLERQIYEGRDFE